jgi:hypothetical protein
MRLLLNIRSYGLETGLVPFGRAVSVELQRKVSHYLQPILSHRFLNNLA